MHSDDNGQDGFHSDGDYLSSVYEPSANSSSDDDDEDLSTENVSPFFLPSASMFQIITWISNLTELR